MKNQFFYTEYEEIEVPNPEILGKEFRSDIPPTIKEKKTYRNSFHTDAVVRSIEKPDGTRVVLLNDWHDEVHMVPEINSKTRKETGNLVKSRDSYSSQIFLNKEDNERFVKLTNIE